MSILDDRDDEGGPITRRNVLLGMLAAFGIGAATAGDDGPEVMLGPLGGGPTADVVGETDGLQWVLGGSYEAALGAVDTRPAILLISSTGGWYLDEQDGASGVETIDLPNIDMQLKIGDTIEQIEAEIDRYPVLAIARSGNTAVIEE